MSRGWGCHRLSLRESGTEAETTENRKRFMAEKIVWPDLEVTHTFESEICKHLKLVS